METEQAARWRRRKDSRPGEILEACARLLRRAGLRRHSAGGRGGAGGGHEGDGLPLLQEQGGAVQGRGQRIPRAGDRAIRGGRPAPGPVSELLAKIGGMFFEKVYSTRFSALPKLVISEASNFPELARFYLDEVVGRGRRLLTALLRRGSRAASSARLTSRIRSTA